MPPKTHTHKHTCAHTHTPEDELDFMHILVGFFVSETINNSELNKEVDEV